MKEGRNTEYPEKTPGDELQKLTAEPTGDPGIDAGFVLSSHTTLTYIQVLSHNSDLLTGSVTQQ